MKNWPPLLMSVLALSVALMAPANALDFNFAGPFTQGTAVPPPPDARIIIIDPMRLIDTERDVAWVNDCAPEIVTDKLGVGRYVYKHAGCEYGTMPGTVRKVQ